MTKPTQVLLLLKGLTTDQGAAKFVIVLKFRKLLYNTGGKIFLSL